MAKLCEVVVSVAALYDRVFTYTGEAAEGSLVKVPLGNRQVAGLVLRQLESEGVAGEDLKALGESLYGGHAWLSRELLELSSSLARFYLGPMGNALEVMLPVPFANKEVSGWSKGRTLLAGEKIHESLLRNEPARLSDDQERSIREISTLLDNRDAPPLLLHGVTGSGKTEVYLQSLARVLESGRQAIYLVPEISLTPQAIANLRHRFGEKVAMLHSGLSPGQRARTWQAIQRGEFDVVVGPRSAVFAPLTNLGLIIIDEEHEGSYRHEGGLNFHARIAAQMRVRHHKGLLLLGSATPSLEAYYSGERGRTKVLNLKSRPLGSELPKVHIIDMREELRLGSTSLLSEPLQMAMKEQLDQGYQVVLFFNRRGYATVSLCTSCGHVAVCPHCDVSLHLHLASKALKCHYCGHAQASLRRCPKCNSDKIRSRGAGTQKLEEEIKILFPHASVSRVDADTTSRKGSHGRILSEFANSPNHILLGTRMIAKGLDFPLVTVVGVIDADSGLYFPDFRAVEETFQLIMQVAGRAGRGKDPGTVFIQTYNPDNYAVRLASQQDYGAFYRLESRLRRRMNYPPFGAMATMNFRGANQQRVVESARGILELFSNEQAVATLGPAPSCPERVKDIFRWQLTLKAKSRSVIQECIAKKWSDVEKTCAQGVHCYVLLD